MSDQRLIIKKYAIYDGPGIRSTVFFSGCPLSCWWCQNPEFQIASENNTSSADYRSCVDRVKNEIIKDIIFFDQSGGGVTFSGGEPLSQVNLLFTLLGFCKENSIHTAVDTCGHAQYHDYERISPLVDLYLYDFKLFDSDEHIKYTGVSNTSILDNLGKLSQNGHNVRIRIPLIPHITDTQTNLSHIAQLLISLENTPVVDLLPFNQLYLHKYKRLGMNNKLAGMNSQTNEQIAYCQQLMMSFGLTVNIGGGR